MAASPSPGKTVIVPSESVCASVVFCCSPDSVVATVVVSVVTVVTSSTLGFAESIKILQS